MAIEDHIACPRCGRAIVPRLNFYDGTPVTYNRVQHVCPLCGAVAFESGGGVRWGMLIALLVMVGACVLIVVLGVILSGR
jgi:predicted RNA-binding Zn-ribbon protein involved in translation (DUF1610 family)